ncbi:MAG TPA: SusD/RagB family nutrient-binding outer membrane lipoprotein [Gemmatimonadaceae bacterium]|nr:SusD/RagB family nutrient-binding outer membrane lipoprotein [Gemmatimonadaceae bacterium]
MNKYIRTTSIAALVLASAVGCKDFLSGGELSNDPNRPSAATNRQLFVGIQSNIFAEYTSELSRLSGLFTQQLFGAQSQYIPLYAYGIDENSTNGQHTALYSAGGLVDIRNLQAGATALGDFHMLGIAKIQEALLMSLGADYFGDLVYTEALQGGNPALTEQLAIYDALQVLLDEAITDLASTAVTNLGPGDGDILYGGDTDNWTALARSLKARIYLNTAEVRPAAYAQALAQARLGIQTADDDYTTVWSAGGGEENLFYQFTNVQRFGYAEPNPFFVSLIESRNDPRESVYLDANPNADTPFGSVDSPDYPQQILSADENTLIWAEAAYRGGDQVEALLQLNRYRAANGIAAGVEVGPALLREILTEKYIELFIHPQAFTDYRRTCFPNLTPVTAGQKIPGRLFYDTLERQTNPSIPAATAQPTRNDNDPANATDPFGNVCLGQ